MPARQPITLVDAFTDRAFGGNPAAVCLLSAARGAAWMQLVAREMNLAETAFLVRRPDGYDLRWFTPTVEVDLCGHATLASAHVLWEDGLVAAEATIPFHTRSGVLTATHHEGLVWLDFPATPAVECEVPPEIGRALGVPIRFAGRSPFDYLVEVDSAETLRGLQPDLAALGRLAVRGVIVTAPSSSAEADFVSRFFAPASGVPEDPVTGSAHCALAPFWSARLGRTELLGYQASERGGLVRVRLRDDRVHLGGNAVTVLRGELLW
ncbi:MAG: PhzF family phenazine biosynthesis protein [Gemmatimonadales bacterium]